MKLEIFKVRKSSAAELFLKALKHHLLSHLVRGIYPISESGGEAMQETALEYTQRLLSYSEGKDPLRSQQAAPIKLAALLKGKTGKQLTRRPAPDKWSIAE